MLENLHRFAVYTLLTSTGSFDTGRAITNAIAIALLGPAVLAHAAAGATADRGAPGSGPVRYGPDQQDPVVAGRRVAAAVAVARGHPQVAVGRDDDGAHPAVRRRRRSPPGRDAAPPVDVDPPQPLAAQRRQPERARRGRPARTATPRRCARRPAGCVKPRPVALALDLRPAVVGARSIRLSSSQVSWPNSEAHSWPLSSKASPCTLRWPRVQTGELGSGLPGCRLAVRRDPQDLAAERVSVLGERRRRRSRRWRRRAAVRAEGEPAAVVDERRAGCR